MSESNEHVESAMPFFDGDKGWVAPEYKAPTPRFPGKHNSEGGWIFGGQKPTFQTGQGGWISDGTKIEEEQETSSEGVSRNEMHKKKYHGGKNGWYAPTWEKVYDKNEPYDRNPNLPVPSSSTSYISSFQPHCSISNGDKTIVVEIELPGVDPENVSLEIVSQVAQKVPFTSNTGEKAIVARSPHQSDAKNCFLLIRGYKHSRWDARKVLDEREYGFFERALFLGNEVNKDSPMMAKLDQGVLVVYVAKPKQLQK